MLLSSILGSVCNHHIITLKLGIEKKTDKYLLNCQCDNIIYVWQRLALKICVWIAILRYIYGLFVDDILTLNVSVLCNKTLITIHPVLCHTSDCINKGQWSLTLDFMLIKGFSFIATDRYKGKKTGKVYQYLHTRVCTMCIRENVFSLLPKRCRS